MLAALSLMFPREDEELDQSVSRLVYQDRKDHHGRQHDKMNEVLSGAQRQ